MIVWCDLETTGLDPDYATILELGLIVTDDDLNELGRRNWVLHLHKRQHEGMDQYVLDMHAKNGLLKECAVSALFSANVQAEALDWLDSLGLEANTIPLAGNTISFDKKFLDVYMPSLHRFFHYRSIDMSSVNELAKRWNPALYAARPNADVSKEDAPHRALPDLDNSIALARYYRELLVPVCILSPKLTDEQAEALRNAPSGRIQVLRG